MNRSLSLLALSLTLWPLALRAEVRLPAIISEHMVLQQAEKVPIWGWAAPGEEVSVTLSEQTIKTVAGPDGKWMVSLNLKDSAAGPFELTVQGKNQIKIADVVVGQVWVASGQSNMQMSLGQTLDGEKEAAAANNPSLRVFRVPTETAREPQESSAGTWVVVTPQSAKLLSAVAYYFGKKLQQELKVPVGLINSGVGGTPAEAWTPQKAIDSVPDLRAARERIWREADAFASAGPDFLKTFPVWLQETQRTDKASDAAAFAGVDVDTSGWQTVKLPGPIKAEGLPTHGAIWLRQEIDVADPAALKRVRLAPHAHYESLYWNGQLVSALTYKDLPDAEMPRSFALPQGVVKAGRNIVALRLYSPIAPFELPGTLYGTVRFSPDWKVKAEYALPAPSADEIARAPKAPQLPLKAVYSAAHLYNAMIHPLVPYAIKGVIWYQGEANTPRAAQYATTFPLLIEGWREAWGQGTFPFYFCQLANNRSKQPQPGESGWAELRDSQSQALRLPHTGQAVLIDLGESGDIHPMRKKEVGDRLALIALAQDYGRTIPFSGPVYQSLKVEGNKARLSFKHTDQGLVAAPLPATYPVQTRENKNEPLVRNSPKSELEGFAICGADKQWVWADAKIEGSDVLVWCDKVPVPVAVRYAWADNPNANLYNGAGLPASPFRTDDFPLSTAEAKY